MAPTASPLLGLHGQHGAYSAIMIQLRSSTHLESNIAKWLKTFTVRENTIHWHMASLRAEIMAIIANNKYLFDNPPQLVITV